MDTPKPRFPLLLTLAGIALLTLNRPDMRNPISC